MPPHQASRRALDLAAVLQQLPDGVIVADEAMRVRFANDAAGKLLGCTPDQLVGEPVEQLVPPSLRAAHLNGVQRLVDTRRPRLIGGRALRVPALRRDGSEVEIELTLGAAGHPGSDGFLVIASLRDVSEEIETQREAASARYLRAMLDVISELHGADDLDAAFARMLPALCGSLDWDSAALWSPEAEGDGTTALVCRHSWVDNSLRDQLDSLRAIAATNIPLRIPYGAGLPGRAFAERRSIALRGDEVPPEWPRSPLFNRLTSLQLVALPLLAHDGEVLGVVELHSLRPGTHGEGLIGVLDAIGRQIGEVVAGLQADEQRRRAEQEREELLVRMQAAERSQSFLLQASRLLGMARSFAESLDALAALAVPTLGDICLIDVAAEDGRVMRMAARHADPGRQHEVEQLGRRYPPRPGGAHPSVSVMRSGQSMWSDTMSDEFLRGTTRDEEHYWLVKGLGFSSYLSVPLTSRRRVLGTITIVSTNPDHRISSTELILAESLASQAAEIVEKARRYEREHEMAHVLQSGLLPGALEELPGYEIAVRYLPSTLGAEVGGDWYDIVTLADGTKAVTVGDVSGHDVRAAAAMGQLRSAARALASRAAGPGELIDGMREGWDRLGIDRTATVAVGTLHRDGRAVFASAGHPPPLLVAGGDCVLVPIRPSTPLGAPATPTAELDLEIPPGATVLLYTDGLIEARQRELAEGLEALRQRLCGGASSAEELSELALAGLGSERADDVALLAVRRSG